MTAKSTSFESQALPDVRQALEEQLKSNSEARYFIYEEAPMYTQRESELLQHFLQEQGGCRLATTRAMIYFD